MAANPRQCNDKFKQKVDINHDIKIFTEDEIKRMTRNYSTAIGKGGFGEVYRGLLDDNDELVAVKRYIRSNLTKEFMEEVSIHSQMKHKNVVKLIGYCIGETTLTMVSEYIPRGNLEDILHRIGYSFTLDTILGIAIGCAEALSYMHSMHLSSDNLVCHGDIKPANILLDANLRAKVSDFGLSRLLSGGITKYTSLVKGSLDYMDPIYMQSGRLTPRSDVYSFGIVLLELIARKRVRDGSFSLIETFTRQDCTKWSKLRELVEIANVGNMAVLVEIGKLAMDCLTLEIDKRPKINDVAIRLKALWNVLRRGQDIGWFKKSFGTFRRSSRNSAMLERLSNVRMFTMDELTKLTQNWSFRFQIYPNTVYKGTLEDNTAVAVYWPKLGNLYDILNGEEDFPLYLRVKIAVQTAEALEYLHSSGIGITAHDSVQPCNLLVDANFTPKFTSFSWVRKLAKQTGLPVNDRQIDCGVLVLSRAQKDVYDFGILLLSLISRKKMYDEKNLDIVNEFTKAYDVDHSGNAMFDKDIITVQGNNTVLEGIGRLALKCTLSKEEERPKMLEVAEHLRMLRRCCRASTDQEATSTCILAFHPKASFAFTQATQTRSR
ncbi:unnamed protein product [Miscanthus lutarioriparius]|uniref:Protein kinase domain-containing protein n=1 Tax=Miscanthus lutarioriparius TaxID=422564 RepID=A0A811SQE3_9POAL|nr:unnamed protein product [Miscanthus lutarioriparius]